MIALTVAELAGILGGQLTGEGDGGVEIGSVTADSRMVGPGSLFVALAGERADGHDYVPGAMRAGAAGCLTARPVEGALCVVVDDPLFGLGRLARELVDRAVVGGLQIVAVTGSQGKTSTKDLLAQILETAGPTVAPLGNLNNELGVPLTVSRIDRQTRFLIAEMGARGIGHIAYLCDIAPPRVGVVLNVGHAHVGEFGGRAAIAQAKGELVDALPADGIAVLNADDPLVWAMRSRTSARLLAFSDHADPGMPGVWATDPVTGANGCYSFALHARPETGPEAQVEVELRVTGRHQVGNAVAAAGAALAVGLDLDAVGSALSAAGSRSRWRMELHQRADGVTRDQRLLQRESGLDAGRHRRRWPNSAAVGVGGPGPCSATCSSWVTPPKPSTRRSVDSSPSWASTSWWRSASTPSDWPMGRRAGAGAPRSRPSTPRPMPGPP